MHEPQELKEQVKMLASIAIANNGTASNKFMAKRLGESKITYRYVRYVFDFICDTVSLCDKVNPESLFFLTAEIHLKIDDNLLVIVVKGRGGYKKILTQMNVTEISVLNNVLTLSSPTCTMELK